MELNFVHPPRRSSVIFFVGLSSLLFILLGVWLYPRFYLSPAPVPDSYQAVFLVNGQVYFGKMQPADWGHVKLTNVHYLQVSGLQSNQEEEATQVKNAKIIALGGEVHSPLTYMIIPKQQILFWEDLKDDSRLDRAMREKEFNF